jgi:ribonuclease HII
VTKSLYIYFSLQQPFPGATAAIVHFLLAFILSLLTVPILPTADLERSLIDNGNDIVAGLDEVGRGAWAGPLCVCLAVFNCQRLQRMPEDLRLNLKDSKQIPEIKREKMFESVSTWCLDYAIGSANSIECDNFGMSKALEIASERAFRSLKIRPSIVIVDGPRAFFKLVNAISVVDADQKCVSVSAASLLAKVSRDRMMVRLSKSFPQYGFDVNKGYGTKNHLIAINGWGLSQLHRKSWRYIDKTLWRYNPF